MRQGNRSSRATHIAEKERAMVLVSVEAKGVLLEILRGLDFSLWTLRDFARQTYADVLLARLCDFWLGPEH